MPTHPRGEAVTLSLAPRTISKQLLRPFVLQSNSVTEATTTDHSAGVTEQSTRANVFAVIPAFNEERFIAGVVLKTRPLVAGVIVVDDGSTDLTSLLAEAVGAHVVRLQENRGKAQALNAGFAAALGNGADVIVCLDADAQHDPNDIPTVIEPILERSADVVVGSRFLSVRSEIPAWRRTGQLTLTGLTNTLSGTRISDSQSGFRAFSGDAARKLRFHSSGLSVESEMQFLFDRAQLRVAEVPIRASYLDGNKRNPIVHGLQVLDALLSLVARRRPLLFFTLPGTLLGLMGLVLGARVVVIMQNTNQLMTGTAVLTSLMVLVGSLLAVTGIMLHSMGHFVVRMREEFSPGNYQGARNRRATDRKDAAEEGEPYSESGGKS